MKVPFTQISFEDREARDLLRINKSTTMVILNDSLDGINHNGEKVISNEAILNFFDQDEIEIFRIIKG